MFASERQADGWTNSLLVAPGGVRSGQTFRVADATRDGRTLALMQSDIVNFSSPGPGQRAPDRLWHRTADGTYRVVAEDTGPSGRTYQTQYIGMSADGDRVLYASDHSPEGLPSTEGVSKVYEWKPDGSVARLASTGSDPLADCGVTGTYGPNSVNAEGTTAFVVVTSGDGCTPGQLWRIGPGGSVPVSDPGETGARFVGASPDGTYAHYTSDVAGSGQRIELQRWTADGVSCLTCDGDGIPANQPGGDTAVASPNGAAVFFQVQGSFNGAGDPTAGNVFVARGSVVRLVRSGSFFDTTPGGQFGVNRDGTVVVIADRSTSALYRVDMADSAPTTTCLSCDLAGAPQGATMGFPLALQPNIGQSVAQGASTLTGAVPAVSDDGRTVAFASTTALTADAAGVPTAYRWRDGQGTAAIGTTSPAAPPAVSPSGRTVFFYSDDNLAGDGQNVSTLYAARDGGGFAPQQPAPAPCTGDLCQPSQQPGPAPPTPGSTPQAVTGNAQAPTRTAKPTISVARLSRAARSKFARTGQVALKVRTTSTGRVLVRASANVAGRNVRVASAGYTATQSPQTARLTLKLSKAARRQLRSRGSLRVAIRITQEGAATRNLSLTLKRKVG